MRKLTSALVIITALIAATTQARAQTPCPTADEPSPYAPAPPQAATPCGQQSICIHVSCPAARPQPPRPPRPRLQLSMPRFGSDDDRHQFLWNTSDAYRSALTMRRLGTALAILGGAGSIVLGTVAGVQSMECGSSYDSYYGGSSSCDVSPAIYVGVAASAVALAVGVTLAFSGHHRVKKIRERFHVGLAPLPGGGTAAMSLRF
ncbi:MAG: hypothetical protein KC503_20905 [Myxococcales bacterium]|nr:hypothetical protein [Myxococcales bacterium]